MAFGGPLQGFRPPQNIHEQKMNEKSLVQVSCTEMAFGGPLRGFRPPQNIHEQTMNRKSLVQVTCSCRKMAFGGLLRGFPQNIHEQTMNEKSLVQASRIVEWVREKYVEAGRLINQENYDSARELLQYCKNMLKKIPIRLSVKMLWEILHKQFTVNLTKEEWFHKALICAGQMIAVSPQHCKGYYLAGVAYNLLGRQKDAFLALCDGYQFVNDINQPFEQVCFVAEICKLVSQGPEWVTGECSIPLKKKSWSKVIKELSLGNDWDTINMLLIGTPGGITSLECAAKGCGAVGINVGSLLNHLGNQALVEWGQRLAVTLLKEGASLATVISGCECVPFIVALHLSLKTGSFHLLTYILEVMTDPEQKNMVDSKGDSAFHIIVKSDLKNTTVSETAIRLFLNHNFTLDLRDSCGKLPVEYLTSTDQVFSLLNQTSKKHLGPSDEDLQSVPLSIPVQATEPHEQVSMVTECTGTQPNAYHGCPASERYPMESKPRGYVLIINNIKFVDPNQNRDGAEQDEKMLEEVFLYLGFQVAIKNDLTSDQMLCKIRDFSLLESHSEADSCILAILSHGDEGNDIYGYDMKKLSLTEVYSLFNNDKCESLRGKPKMFLIQACRGRPTYISGKVGNSMTSVSTQGDGGETLSDSGDQNVHQVIPPKADMLIALSTTEGDLAYRNTENGSWFIQVLVEVLRQYSYHEEVSHMLMKVNGKVSAWNNSGADSSLTQMPEFTLTLTKKWYLNPLGMVGAQA